MKIFPVIMFLTGLLLVSTNAAAVESIMVKDPVRSGEAYFNKYCAGCHGIKGAGTDKGPPLVHRIYRPNHHSDWSFRRAVTQGVSSHHWRFGNMPPVKGVAPEEVDDIIKYVRKIQKDAGIF
ncbi:MAG: c-type cytochrome [Thermodesulfobacteriota bacterium]